MPLDAALIAAICDAERSRELLGGRYRLVEGMGSGDFALTYKATDEVTGETVVVRVAKRSRASMPGMAETFVVAARGADGVEHPAFPKVLANGVTEDGCPFVVRTYVEGELAMSLRQRGQLGGRELVDVLIALAEPLAAMHANGQVHGALEGRRALVGRQGGQTRVALLGVGRFPLEEATGSGPVGRSCIAPEVKAGAHPSVLSDVYGFCAMCAELAMGRAFGDGWRKAVDGVGIEGLRAAIEHGLAIDPAARWQSVQEIIAALRFLLDDPSGQSQPAGVHDLETMSRAPAVSPKASTGETPKPVAYSVATMASPKLEGIAPIARNGAPRIVPVSPRDETLKSTEGLANRNSSDLHHLVAKGRADASPMAHSASPRAPTNQRIGRFLIGRLLGRGGMGEVYEAVDPILDRRVAFKVIRTDADGVRPDAEALSRLLREARAAAVIGHPNVVAVYEAGEADCGAYIVMELVEGETLREKLGHGSLAADAAVRIVIEIARGLERAHSLGIVHRDIKPENVMLTADGRVKILDFGIARLVNGVGLGSLTETGALMGTPRYMSPEQARGETVDWRSDQFALGVLAYELLTSQSPWNCASGHSLISSIMNASVRSWDGVPAHLVPFLTKTLARNASDRFSSWELAIGAIESTRPRPTRLRSRFLRWTAYPMAALVAVIVGSVGPAKHSRAGASESPATQVANGSSVSLTAASTANSETDGALLAFEHAAIDTASRRLEDAIKADPKDRHSLLSWLLLTTYPTDIYRQRYVSLRDASGAMTTAEKDLLEALAPRAAIPPDYGTAADNLAAACDRHSDFPACDAYAILGLWAGRRFDQALQRVDRGLVTVNTAFLHWIRGKLLLQWDKSEESRTEFQKCIALAPSATACLGELNNIYATDGECVLSEKLSQALVAGEPDNPSWYLDLARARFGRGASTSAVATLIAQHDARLSASSRTFASQTLAFDLAVLRGDFQAAEAAGAVTMQEARARGTAIWLLQAADRVFQLQEEQGKLRLADELTREVLNGEDSMLADFNDEFRREGCAWRRRIGATPHANCPTTDSAPLVDVVDWYFRSGLGTRTEAEARASLEALGRLGNPAAVSYRFRIEFDSEVGRVALLAGNLPLAEGHLLRAVHSCHALLRPLRHTQAALNLGLVSERLGKRSQACSAYSITISRWGREPRSISGRIAKGRSQNLGCDPIAGNQLADTQ